MLGRKAALASLMTVGARLGTRLIDLATMVVLARFLLPTDFGRVGIAMSVMLVVEIATELSVNQALVRLPNISRSQYDTAFTLSLVRGFGLFFALTMIAYPFAVFYDDPKLTLLVIILSLAPIARGMASPALATYQKDMSFWRDLATETCGKTVSSIIAIYVAIETNSYWSLAVATVLYPVCATIVSYVLAPYRPRLSIVNLREFLGFLGWASAAQIVFALNWQFERLLLAKLRTASDLGLFAVASDIAGIPFLALFGPILRPLLAAFSLLGEQDRRLARSYQTASAGILAIGLPILVGESLLAEPAVRLVLGEQWLGAAPLLRWLALGTIPALLALPAIPLFMSRGDTRSLFHRNILEISVKIPIAVCATILFGFIGIVFSRFVSELVAAVFCIKKVRSLLNISVKEQLSNMWRSVASTMVMAVFVAVCLQYQRSAVSIYDTGFALVSATSVGFATYSVSTYMFWRIAGSPAGIEAIAVSVLMRLFTRSPARA